MPINPELAQYQGSVADHTPWYGRPKNLHQRECAIGKLGWEWYADTGSGKPCCRPNYNVNRNPGVDGTPRVPRGFIQPYRAPSIRMDVLGQEISRRSEIDLLASQQHAPDCLADRAGVVDPLDPCCDPPDIAPEAMILHEEYRGAVELDRLPPDGEATPELADDDPIVAFQVAPDESRGRVSYDTSAGWEQAMAEWEKWTRLCGPIETYRWEVRDDGRVTLTLRTIAKPGARSPELTRKITASEKQSILLRQYIALRDDMPDADSLITRRAGYEEMRLEWGDKWNAILNARAPKPLSFEWPDVNDPYRHQFHETDDRHTGGLDPEVGYAGPVVIGHDDDNDEQGTRHVHVVEAHDGTQIVVRERDLF